jgi:hypothetical protein
LEDDNLGEWAVRSGEVLGTQTSKKKLLPEIYLICPV